MNLARFLTPSKVLEFIKFRNYSPSAINLEVVNSVLCLAYSGNQIFTNNPAKTIYRYKEFKQYILDFRNERFENLLLEAYALFNKRG